MLSLTSSMERQFFKTISAEPDENVWSIVSDETVRIMKDMRKKRIMKDMKNMTRKRGSSYIAITSISVPAEPELVHRFLVEENINLLVNCKFTLHISFVQCVSTVYMFSSLIYQTITELRIR